VDSVEKVCWRVRVVEERERRSEMVAVRAERCERRE